MKLLQKIVSGAQTGADRAALDFAIENYLEYEGFVPKGRLAEDGVIPAIYQNLIETESTNYAERTELNVLHSDATLIVSHGALKGGSLYTKKMAEKHGKPYLHIDFERISLEQAAQKLREWIISINCRILNVAGPRASSDPQIYQKTKALLELLLQQD